MSEPAPPAPPPGDSVEAVAAELALASIKTRAGLRALRRRFMWANHPDRRPDWPRDLANRRVAIVNMLIDAALRERGGDGRSPQRAPSP